jgi:hypothetical protein
MTKVQGSIVFLCSAAVLIGCSLWYYADPGYEPAIGIVGSFGGLIASYWPFKAKSPRLTPEKKIEARERWRPIFENFFFENAQSDFKTDAIIRDVARVDAYPDLDEGKGISPWFRCGLAGTYHRGVLLGLRWVEMVQNTDGTWIENYEGTEGTKAILLGAVPYESIESVNWEGDNHYHKPHIFCHFDHKGEPYERLFYAKENRFEHPSVKQPPSYTELAEYAPKSSFWWKIFQRFKRI